MIMMRYQPWSLFNTVARDAAREVARDPAQQEARADWAPAVDIREEQHRYVIEADVPGIEAKDITLQTDKGVLTIKGERARVGVDEQRQYQSMERARGIFVRGFTLPDAADTENITARTQNGVLQVMIPKVEKHQQRKIVVEG